MKKLRLAVPAGSAPNKPRKIADEIRHLVFMGRLKAGDRLPSVREAADDWGQSKDSVQRAYRHLLEEGVIVDSDERGNLPKYMVSLEVKEPAESERIAKLDALMVQLVAKARKLGYSVEEVQSASERVIDRINTPRTRKSPSPCVAGGVGKVAEAI
ncbi:TPA: GntR family transcriptional regulator [Stenotrophomonas maltophilia]|uniref:GntR family transcriptional regulator n=1 Tax=Gammaproteobacteria TaxID=1236 RepID=UPI000E3293C0|nr:MULTISPECIES: GntR family transcriptional regulator [Gammaproteobacteria]MCR1808081.1 GntR family transcriptional regulator [Stenotrophomonas geniculata]UXF78758.1 GntR family transcriptional regulator [Stenotrophomonas maltophilia]